MRHLSLQMLTWGTIAGAVASAVLLAASIDDVGDLRFDAPGAGPAASAEPRLRQLRSEFARDRANVTRPARGASAASTR